MIIIDIMILLKLYKYRVWLKQMFLMDHCKYEYGNQKRRKTEFKPSVVNKKSSWRP